MNTHKIYLSLPFLATFLLAPLFVFAAPLQYVSDTLGKSASATATPHILQFTTANAVPPGGKIVYIPSDGDFTIPGSMSYVDVDLQYAPTTTNAFIDRLVGTTTSSTTDAVTFTSGTSGDVTFELNTDTGIGAGVQVRIFLGTNAIYNDETSTTSGLVNMINPTATTTYWQTFETLDAADTLIDTGRTGVAITDLVGVGPVDTTETIPPFIYNAAPEGEIANSITSAEISLNTDELAVCRYSLTPGVDFDDMVDEFPITGLITHAGVIASDLEYGTTYHYYIRCIDDEGNKNTVDYNLSFYLAPPPKGGGSGAGGGGGSGGGSGNNSGGGGSSGGGGGGGGAPFPPDTASVSFEGIAFPLSTLYILQDGTIVRTLALGSDGAFDTTLANIPYGTYTFGVYAIDQDEVRSSTFNSTFSLVGGTGNTISDIFMSPTLVLDSDKVAPGGILGISGTAIAGTDVEIWTYRQKQNPTDAEITKIIASVDNEGRWSSAINTSGFFRDTYQIKIRSLFPNGDESFFSDFQFYGVGVDPNPITLLSADLNRDGSVNLIDFSILLFHWGTDGGDADPPPDINQDGTVSLTDFSIMLFQWTG